MVSIIIHILPQEIDQLEQTLIALKKCSTHTNKDYLVEVVMNTNLTDFDDSILNLEFFHRKFLQLEKLTESWAKTNFWVSEYGECLGCTDPRRKCGQYDTEATIWLDVDIVFSDTILGHLELAIDSMEHEDYVITPETTRLWDNTWDVITNKEALNEEANHDNYFGRDPYTSTGVKGEVHLKPINTFQWRIYKNHPKIQWVNKVHEVLTGYKHYSDLHAMEEFSLYHPKDIERQVKQNNFYNTL